MLNFSVTKNGKDLDSSLYTWDEETRTFGTKENGLVLDFNGIDDCTFKTGSDCTFKTGYKCTFKTGSGCNFNTGSECTFKTCSWCTFKTGSDCTFKTGSDCTFDTGSYCTFDTDSDCTFDTGYKCTFKTGSKCVVVRRDVYNIIELPKNKKIKLNGCGVKGYQIIKDHKIIIDDKEIMLSAESFNALKKSLTSDSI